MKIFCIGAAKTATNTVKNALEILGYNIDDKLWDTASIRRNYHDGRTNLVYPYIEKFDGFIGSPFDHKDFYKNLFEKYPDAKFILTIRHQEQWYELLYAWLAVELKHNRSILPDYNIYLKEWYDVPITQSHFKGDIPTNKDALINTYNQRNAAIITFFAERNALDRLLILDTGNFSWRKIAPFVNKPEPDVPFPDVELLIKKKIPKRVTRGFFIR